jgi:uncharacterized lipoprotein YajG
MKLVAVAIVVAMLAGCAAPRDLSRVPAAVQIMPNDCANRTMIIQWLSRQAAISRTPFETQESYDQAQAQIRYRIWNVRYNCQPV